MPVNHEAKVTELFHPPLRHALVRRKGTGVSEHRLGLSRSAPRLSGRPRVEALVACGAHQIHTQVTCTREVGGRESGRGRRRERACVPVPLSSGEREEGAHAHFSSKKAALNHAPSVAT